jgi:DNA-binding NarL/FixJ family response regulator
MIVAMEIESILVKLGCEVIGVAMSGEEALSSAEKQPPDLALMDLRLKGAMDGIEAAREIIARFGARVVFVTAHSDPSTLSKFREIGAAGYLRKPFTPQGLAAIIHQALTDSGSQYDH